LVEIVHGCHFVKMHLSNWSIIAHYRHFFIYLSPRRYLNMLSENTS